MKRFLLIPDSFKGTMSSLRICELMREALEQEISDCQIRTIPVADGGEGSVEAFLAASGGQRHECVVPDPFFKPIKASYAILPDQTAVIEMASCAGLPLVGERLRPDQASTYGVGKLILDAMMNNCPKIIVGLGGSATNDGGCGAAAALGVHFKDESGEAFVPTGNTLKRIRGISVEDVRRRLTRHEIIAMCDIDNPLYGEQGAAAIFAPQKGAGQEMVRELDEGLRHLDSVIRRDLGLEVAALPGAGAAGGMGAGMCAFFGGRMKMGIEVVLDTVHFDELLEQADYVITGEGKLDRQSLRGKVVIGVARRAKRAGVPVIAVVGDAEDPMDDAYKEGLNAVFSINRVALPYQESRKRAETDLKNTVRDIARLLSLRQ